MIRKLFAKSDTRIQFLKFLVVGVINTLVSLVVIYGCMYLGLNYKISNLAGYVAGVANSFIWNKWWVFRTKERGIIKEMFFFGVIFALCYGLQYVVLLILVAQWGWNAYLGQLLSMGVYTLANFILNRLITFKK